MSSFAAVVPQIGSRQVRGEFACGVSTAGVKLELIGAQSQLPLELAIGFGLVWPGLVWGRFQIPDTSRLARMKVHIVNPPVGAGVS